MSNSYSTFLITVFFNLFFINKIYSQEINIKEGGEAEIFITSQSTNQLLEHSGKRVFKPFEQPDEFFPTIMIDVNKKFQVIEGFGGAFTDAASITFAKLPKKSQEKILKACFSPLHGNGYTLCRTTIHSSDYSDEMYTYAEVADDEELKHFTIEHDLKYRIPFIKRAQEVSGGNIKFLASPWSPPAWMKTNGSMLEGGKLLKKYNQTWANYFMKYIKSYENEGIPIWALTVQNEPMATQVWESCVYTAEEEKNFVRDYLGPTLSKNGLDHIKIIIWDHNRGIMYQRAKVAYDDPEAYQYIWGTAFHWYTSETYDNVRMVHDAWPDKKLLFTESGMDGSWSDANNLARNMIKDFNNWTNGWIFWNLLLDQNRGPRHKGGKAPGEFSSIITANTVTGEVDFNPPHYVFGHFSRFIKPGARRIACTSNNDNFIATSFINLDGKVAVVIQNLKDKEQDIRLWSDGMGIEFNCPASAIVTLTL